MMLRENILERSVEYWTVIAGMVLYIIIRDAEREALQLRAVKTLSTGLLTYGLTPALSTYFHDSEVFAAIICMLSILFILDAATGILRNKKLMEKILLRRVDNSEGNKDE